MTNLSLLIYVASLQVRVKFRGTIELWKIRLRWKCARYKQTALFFLRFAWALLPRADNATVTDGYGGVKSMELIQCFYLVVVNTYWGS